MSARTTTTQSIEVQNEPPITPISLGEDEDEDDDGGGD